MCKNFQETGKCKYGWKCQYAHGSTEMKSKTSTGNRKYKTVLCQKFYTEGYCKYGARCTYRHDQREVKEVLENFHYQKKLLNYN